MVEDGGAADQVEGLIGELQVLCVHDPKLDPVVETLPGCALPSLLHGHRRDVDPHHLRAFMRQEECLRGRAAAVFEDALPGEALPRKAVAKRASTRAGDRVKAPDRRSRRLREGYVVKRSLAFLLGFHVSSGIQGCHHGTSRSAWPSTRVALLSSPEAGLSALRLCENTPTRPAMSARLPMHTWLHASWHSGSPLGGHARPPFFRSLTSSSF